MKYSQKQSFAIFFKIGVLKNFAISHENIGVFVIKLQA